MQLQPIGLAQRLERYARTRDPADLWPGLDERARLAAARELERVTRDVLAGRGEAVLDPRGDLDGYAVAIAAHTTGMGPVLGRWLEDGRLSAHERHRAALGAHIAHSRERVARLHAGVLPAVDALLAHGITPGALKGYHTGLRYFDEPGARRMSDVDLHVPQAQATRAYDAIASAGFRPASADLVPHKRDWIAAGVDERIHSVELSDAQTKWTLETHTSLDRRFAEGSWARLDAITTFVPFTIEGRPLRVLDAPSLVISLACHCSEELESSRLLRLFEMVQVIRAEPSLDWRDVAARLREAHAPRFVYPAFALVEQLAPHTIPADVVTLARNASTWAARHAVARMVPAGGAIDQHGLARHFMWTSGAAALAKRIAWRASPANTIPDDARPGWRAHLRRLRSGALSLRAPDERAQ